MYTEMELESSPSLVRTRKYTAKATVISSPNTASRMTVKSSHFEWVAPSWKVWMTIATTMTRQTMAVPAMPNRAMERKESVRRETRTGMAEAASSCTSVIRNHTDKNHAAFLMKGRLLRLVTFCSISPPPPPPPPPALNAKVRFVTSLTM